MRIRNFGKSFNSEFIGKFLKHINVYFKDKTQYFAEHFKTCFCFYFYAMIFFKFKLNLQKLIIK